MPHVHQTPATLPRSDKVGVSATRISRVPLVSQPLLRSHNCFISTDTRYRAAARLGQSLWREARGLPQGSIRPRDQLDVVPLPLGSRLDDDASRRGANFISPAVHALVRRETALCEEGALIETERLHSNMLSSTGLVFNLLGPLALKPEVATAVFQTLLPAFVHTVTGIRFETSPGRGDPRYLGDYTAFDAALDIITPDGEPGTIFIEVKLSEGLSGPAATSRPRYDEVSREGGLFINPESSVLRSRAVEQFWRLHMLAGLAVQRAVTPRALFVTISPALNRRVAAALTLFTAELVAPVATDDHQVGFVALTLEQVVSALTTAGDTTSASYLDDRYLDFQPVLDLVLSDEPVPPREPPVVPALPAPADADDAGALMPLRSSTIQDDEASSPARLATPPRHRSTRMTFPLSGSSTPSLARSRRTPARTPR